MRRFGFLALLLFTFVGLTATNTEITEAGKKITVSWHAERENEEVKVSSNFAVLSDHVELIVKKMKTSDIDANGNVLRSSQQVIEDRIYIDSYYTLREMHGVTIGIDKVVESNGVKSIIEEIEYELISSPSRSIPSSISPVFAPIYEQLADNYESSYLRTIPHHRSSMLIVRDDLFAENLQDFITWKEQLGVQVTEVNRDVAGFGAPEIKSYIQNEWNNGNRYDYVLLIGDESGEYGIPAFTAGVESDVTDLDFVLMEGNDYFPEMMIGRFSVSTTQELKVIVNKSIAYEKEPYINEFSTENWLDKAIVVAGNHSSGNQHPVTPVNMSRWLHDRLKYDYNYANVDTFFWYGYTGLFPGTIEISNSINAGGGIVSYRGWGNADGWLYPAFSTANIDELSNDNMTPLVFSIVCDTGDYGHPTTNPCFGEKFMRVGSAATHKGAVGFVGPSYLNTKTYLNNGISSGIFHSILRKNIRNWSTAVTFGKMELYRQYPAESEPDGNVNDYFRFYNTLSDPSLNMWIHTPEQMGIDLPSVVSASQNYIDVVADVEDFTVTAISENGDDFYAKVIGNQIAVPIPIDAENVTVTIFKPNYVPVVEDIAIDAPSGITVVGNPFEGMEIDPGTVLSANIEVHNFGTSTETVTAEVTENSEHIELSTTTLEFGSIDANSTATANLEAEILASCSDGEPLEFTLTFSTGDVSKIVAFAHGLNIQILSLESDSFILPGENGVVDFTIMNPTHTDFQNVSLTITDYLVESSFEEVLDLGTIAANEIVTDSFEYEVLASSEAGRPIKMYFDFSDENGHTLRTETFLTPQSNNIPNTVPSFSGKYGYVAYDSNDNHENAPVYNWIEIDPRDGDIDGIVTEMPDDNEITIDLPFDFTYYGQTSDVITICSNGWVALADTWQTNFRNWNLPAPLAPKNLIAPYWDDLKGAPDTSTPDQYDVIPMRIVYYYDEANDQFIVEWNDAYNNISAADLPLEKVQLILRDPLAYPTTTGDGEIIFQYHTVDNPGSSNYCTVGIQNSNATDAVCYSFANSYLPGASELAPGLAIKFTTDQPDNITENNAPEISGETVKIYPNPFNPSTTISYLMTSTGDAKISIFDIRGRKIKTIAQTQTRGRHDFVWLGKTDENESVPTGVYFIKVDTPSYSATKKVMLLK